MYTIATLLDSFPRHLTTVQLAEALGCSVGTAERMCRKERVPATKSSGRWSISRDALTEHLEEFRTLASLDPQPQVFAEIAAAKDRLVLAALKPMMRTWDHGMARSLEDVPRPTDDPRAHASGVDSDRVLLFGTGVSVGWGVLSHDLALPGMLARSLAALTGRGADVDVLAIPDALAVNAIAELREVNLLRYDAVIVTLGLHEAVQLDSIDAWLYHLGGALDLIEDETDPSVAIYVLGVHQTPSMGQGDTVPESIASVHRRALNQATSELLQRRERVEYVSFTPLEPTALHRFRGPREYREDARMFALRIADDLDSRAAAPGFFAERARRAASADDAARVRAVDELGLMDAGRESRFDRIVALAQRAFGTPFATMTVVDSDRTWVKSGIGVDVDHVRREESFCTTTIEQPGDLLVSDARTDSRFSPLRRVESIGQIAFYAGFPIEAPGGERIGALCVFDNIERDIEALNRELLRDLALEAQREVWLGAAR